MGSCRYRGLEPCLSTETSIKTTAMVSCHVLGIAKPRAHPAWHVLTRAVPDQSKPSAAAARSPRGCGCRATCGSTTWAVGQLEVGLQQKKDPWNQQKYRNHIGTTCRCSRIVSSGVNCWSFFLIQAQQQNSSEKLTLFGRCRGVRWMVI